MKVRNMLVNISTMLVSLFVATGVALGSMQINLSSIYVNDQQAALEFYTETLGFKKKNDIPACHNKA